MVKAYVYDKHKQLTLVERPMGLKDSHGNKLPRKVHQFSTIHIEVPGLGLVDVAGLKTDDPKVQEYIEKTDLFKSGRIRIHTPGMSLRGAGPAPTSKAGGLEAADMNPPAAPASAHVKPKGARIGKVK